MGEVVSMYRKDREEAAWFVAVHIPVLITRLWVREARTGCKKMRKECKRAWKEDMEDIYSEWDKSFEE
jgi:hypothetical protein